MDNIRNERWMLSGVVFEWWEILAVSQKKKMKCAVRLITITAKYCSQGWQKKKEIIGRKLLVRDLMVNGDGLRRIDPHGEVKKGLEWLAICMLEIRWQAGRIINMEGGELAES